MNDNEFKKLNRSQLIDIIYQLQLKQEELMEDNLKLSKALEDKRIRINKMGSVAEAVLEIHNVMQVAQEAADHYVEEAKVRIQSERKRILQKANEEAEAIIASAKEEAKKLLPESTSESDEVIKETIVEEIPDEQIDVGECL